MTDDSSKYSSDSDTFYDSEEDIDTYKAQYVEENDDINFFKDLEGQKAREQRNKQKEATQSNLF